MAHEIFGNRFLGRKVPAWHGLGTVFDVNRFIGAEESVREAGCGYELKKVPLAPIHAFGEEVLVNQFAVVRAPTHDAPAQLLGLVSEDYEVVDNITIAQTIEPLSKVWPVETVGALRRGDSFFITLKIGQLDMAGGPVDRFFLVNGNHANKRGTTIVETTVRVVCANTLEMALNDNSAVSLVHRPGAATDLAVATSIVAKLHQLDDQTVQTLELMARTKVTEEQVDTILYAAYPDPIEPSKARFAREAKAAGLNDSISVRFSDAMKYYLRDKSIIDTHRTQAMEAYASICQETPALDGTAWGFLNAITEVENHRPGKTNVLEGIVAGSRRQTMIRALRAATKLAVATGA